MLRSLFRIVLSFQLWWCCCVVNIGGYSLDVENSLHKCVESIVTTDGGYCSHAFYATGVKTLNPADQSNDSIIVYSICHDSITPSSIGNHLLGYFLNAGCAKATGAHFIAPYLLHNDLLETTNNHSFYNHFFYEGLASIAKHENPIPPKVQTTSMKDKCLCHMRCLTHNHEIFTNNLPWMKSQLRKIADEYMSKLIQSYGEEVAYTNPTTGKSTLIPWIPDVSVHYRCGDLIEGDKFHLSGLGLVPFPNLIASLPATFDKKYIYIIPELQSSHSVHGHHRASVYFTHQDEIYSRCHRVYEWLQEFLQVHYPDSTVILLQTSLTNTNTHEGPTTSSQHNTTASIAQRQAIWNANPFLDFIRLMKAKVSIASPTAFSWMAAMGSTQSVYYPAFAEYDVFKGKSASQSAEEKALWEQVIWIEKPEIITSHWPNPWTYIKFDLSKLPITGEDLNGQVVKTRKGRSVFLVSKGERHAFNSGDDFEAMGFKWDQIMTIGDDLINSIPQGADVKLTPKK